MSTVKPEPLALEVALAHYVASLPEGKRWLGTKVPGAPDPEYVPARRVLLDALEALCGQTTTAAGRRRARTRTL